MKGVAYLGSTAADQVNLTSADLPCWPGTIGSTTLMSSAGGNVFVIICGFRETAREQDCHVAARAGELGKAVRGSVARCLRSVSGSQRRRGLTGGKIATTLTWPTSAATNDLYASGDLWCVDSCVSCGGWIAMLLVAARTAGRLARCCRRSSAKALQVLVNHFKSQSGGGGDKRQRQARQVRRIVDTLVDWASTSSC